MRNLVLGLTILTGLFLVGLTWYELTVKSPAWLGHRLPGWQRACWADDAVILHHWTGLPALDRLLHESEEAALYYRLLPAGQPSGSPAPALDIPQQG